jgi:hypothetical protein
MSVKVYLEIGLQNAVDLNLNPGEYSVEVDLDRWTDVEREHLKCMVRYSNQANLDLGPVTISDLSADGVRQVVQTSLDKKAANDAAKAAQQADDVLREIEKKKEAEYIRNIMKEIPIEKFRSFDEAAFVEVPKEFKHFESGDFKAEFAGRLDEYREYMKRKRETEFLQRKQEQEAIETQRALNLLQKKQVQEAIEAQRAPYLKQLNPVMVKRVNAGYGDKKEISEAIYDLMFAECAYANYPPNDYDEESSCSKLSNAEYVKLSEIETEMPEKCALQVCEGHRRIDGVLQREVFAAIRWVDAGFKFLAEVPISTKSIEETADDEDSEDDDL